MLNGFRNTVKIRVEPLCLKQCIERGAVPADLEVALPQSGLGTKVVGVKLKCLLAIRNRLQGALKSQIENGPLVEGFGKFGSLAQQSVDRK